MNNKKNTSLSWMQNKLEKRNVFICFVLFDSKQIVIFYKELMNKNLYDVWI